MNDPITTATLTTNIKEMRTRNAELQRELDDLRALRASARPHPVEFADDDPNRGRMCGVCDHPIPRGQRHAHLERCQRTHPDKYRKTVLAEELTQAHLDKSDGIWHEDGSWTPIDPAPLTDPIEKVEEELIGKRRILERLDKIEQKLDAFAGEAWDRIYGTDEHPNSPPESDHRHSPDEADDSGVPDECNCPQALELKRTLDEATNPERVSCMGCTSFWARKSRCQSVPDDDGPGRFVDISDDARDPIPYWCPGRTPKDDEVEPSIDREVIGTATVDDGGMWSPDECSCLLSVSLQRKLDRLTEVHRYDCASYEASYRKLADRMRAFCRAVLDESPGDTKAMTLDSWTGKAIDAARRHRRIAEGLDGES